MYKPNLFDHLQIVKVQSVLFSDSLILFKIGINSKLECGVIIEQKYTNRHALLAPTLQMARKNELDRNSMRSAQ